MVPKGMLIYDTYLKAIDCCLFTGIDQGRSSSVTDVQSSSEPHGDEPSSGRGSSTPTAGNKDESWPSEFVSKLVKKCSMKSVPQLSNQWHGYQTILLFNSFLVYRNESLPTCLDDTATQTVSFICLVMFLLGL